MTILKKIGTLPPMTDSLLTQEAIDAALINNWEMAITLNENILKDMPNDIDTLNRLGFAYLKTGNYKQAKKTFLQVKSLDPYNQIAIKNLIKLDLMKDGEFIKDADTSTVSPLEFLEDPGKTKIVFCVNVAPSSVLSSIHCGQEVYLKPKNHCVEIRDYGQRYLGALPDDLSFRMIKLIEGKNTYRVFIKTVNKNVLSVIVREISRGKKFANQPSFINSLTIPTYSHDALPDSEKPDISATGEDDDTPDPQREEV